MTQLGIGEAPAVLGAVSWSAFLFPVVRSLTCADSCVGVGLELVRCRLDKERGRGIWAWRSWVYQFVIPLSCGEAVVPP